MAYLIKKGGTVPEDDWTDSPLFERVAALLLIFSVLMVIGLIIGAIAFTSETSGINEWIIGFIFLLVGVPSIAWLGARYWKGHWGIRYRYGKYDRSELAVLQAEDKKEKQLQRRETKEETSRRHSYERENPQLQTIARWIFERDHFTCQNCGGTIRDGKVLYADYIVPLSVGGGLPRDIDNLTTLCASCYAKAHPHMRGS